MKNIYFILPLLGVLFIVSCQKDEKDIADKTNNRAKTESTTNTSTTYEMTGTLMPEDVIAYLKNKLGHMTIPTERNFPKTWKNGLPAKATNPYYFTGDFDSNKNKDHAVLLMDGDQSKIVVVHDIKGTLTHRMVVDGPAVKAGQIKGAMYPRFNKKVKIGPRTTSLNTDAIELKIGEEEPIVYFWDGRKYAAIVE